MIVLWLCYYLFIDAVAVISARIVIENVVFTVVALKNCIFEYIDW